VSYRLEILAAADAHVEAAAKYIAEDNVDAAARFLDAVGATYRELGRSPRRWPVYRLSDSRLENIRKRTVIGFRN
jgi:plasmid stabilization system protein ParE